MPSNKTTIILGVAAIVVLLLLGASGFLLFRGISELNKSGSRLKGSLQALGGLYNANPFPSPANVTVESESLKIINHWHHELNVALCKGQIDPDSQSPSKFMNLLDDKRRELDEGSQRNGTTLPGNFQFGFDRYLATKGTLPDPADVGRLTQQLRMVEMLCNGLFESRVTSISLLKRDEFEAPIPGASGASDRSSRRRFNQNDPSTSAAVAPVNESAGAGLLNPGDLYTTFSFRIEFTAREQALMAFLNRLAKQEPFTVVKTVRTEKSVPDVRTELPAEKRQRDRAKAAAQEAAVVDPLKLLLGGGAPAEPAPEPVEPAKPEKPLLRRDRRMCGFDLEQPMRVKIELDVYAFPAD
ncbi:MAG: hypothetical protein A2498_04025 [Lentisphaerae bacterium RIFOXYC12_FULL_60_16]|nr:MAG: hypothetical protein A2498_04025 [Lentisphaerae bacterium RIFOXYC12_FULL_60_16]